MRESMTNTTIGGALKQTGKWLKLADGRWGAQLKVSGGADGSSLVGRPVMMERADGTRAWKTVGELVIPASEATFGWATFAVGE